MFTENKRAKKNILFTTRIVSASIFAILCSMTSWCSDDAYHSFIMAKHFAEGKGLVYNVGYRVTASTCPLFTLIEGILYYCFNHMYIVAMVMGIFFSTAAVIIIVFKLCKTPSTVILTDTLLLSCYCFMCFTTSGLENSLLYFLFAMFVYVLFKYDKFGGRELFILMFLSGLIALTRMDSVLMLIPAVLYIFFFKTNIIFPKRILISIGGVAPFILWEVFSFLYYGFLFPNTYYVKVCTGFPAEEYLLKGIDFCVRSFSCDIFLLAIPVLFITFSVLCKGKKQILLSSGIIIYTVYVVYVGGDFMLGRHLTVQYFISVAGIICCFPNITDEEAAKRTDNIINGVSVAWCIALACIVFSTCTTSYFKERLSFSGSAFAEETSVADEKAFYTKNVGYTLNMLKSQRQGIDARRQWVGIDWIYRVETTNSTGQKGILVDPMCTGLMDYSASVVADLYLTDKYGLMDPLLSHLPAKHIDSWRVGHMYRAIPEGYEESVTYGKNLIADKSLHEYYDKMLYIITGPVFDSERIKTSIDMNLGRYDYLIDDYLINSNGNTK